MGGSNVVHFFCALQKAAITTTRFFSESLTIVTKVMRSKNLKNSNAAK